MLGEMRNEDTSHCWLAFRKKLRRIKSYGWARTIFRGFCSHSKDNNIDLVIIAGDVYDSSNPPARAEKMFYDTLKKISANGERMTLVISGNHDNPERLVAAGPLAREHGIVMVELLRV